MTKKELKKQLKMAEDYAEKVGSFNVRLTNENSELTRELLFKNAEIEKLNKKISSKPEFKDVEEFKEHLRTLFWDENVGYVYNSIDDWLEDKESEF